MRAVLTIISEFNQGRRTQLRSGQSITVGRTELADLAIPYDAEMSGVHFSLACSFTHCKIKDLGSNSGTLVNGTPVSAMDLNDGDEIFAGGTRFSIALNGPTQTPVATQVPEAAIASDALEPQEESGQGVESVMNCIDSRERRPYAKAFLDDESGVRREALFSAIWTRRSWVLDFCRQAATITNERTWEAVMMLGVLGEPSELPLIISIGENDALKSKRFQVLAAYGHPACVNLLIVEMQNADAKVAIEAGKAFTTITGIEVATETRVELFPEDGSQPDEVEKEFLEQDFLPDARKAHQLWSQQYQQFADSTRIRGGFDVSGKLAMSVFPQLDMESRYQIMLREHFHGRKSFKLANVFRYTQST